MVYRKFIEGILVLMGVLACSQNAEKQTKSTTMNQQETTSQNFVDKVLANVKHYEKEPVYWLQVYKKRDSELEIFVNDMPVFKDYNLEEGYGKPPKPMI